MHFINSTDEIEIGKRISVMQQGPFITTRMESKSQGDDFAVDIRKESEQTVPSWNSAEKT